MKVIDFLAPESIIATLEAKDSLTPDLGGNGDTGSITDAIIERLARTGSE